MDIIVKVYYCENTDLLDERIEMLNQPRYCLGCSREFIEMNFSKIYIEALPHQLADIEILLADCV